MIARINTLTYFLLSILLLTAGCTAKRDEAKSDHSPAPAKNPPAAIVETPKGLKILDANLAQCIKSTNIAGYGNDAKYADANDDGILTTEEAASVTELFCRGMAIRSLEGIEKLTNLKYVNCSGNELGALPNFSALKNLETLKCSNNYFTDADCDELEKIKRNGVWDIEIEKQRDGRNLSCNSVNLVGHIKPRKMGFETAYLHDVWGFVHDGAQYAVYGDISMIHIVEVSDKEPYMRKTVSIHRGNEPKDEKDKDFKADKLWSHPNHSIWGEYRYFAKDGKAYLYASTEGNHNKEAKKVGLPQLLIYDITNIKNPKRIEIKDRHEGLQSAHNITIDKDLEVLVAFGGTMHHEKPDAKGSKPQWKGNRFYSLADPSQPKYLFTVGDLYVHDAQIKTEVDAAGVLKTRLYAAHGSTAIHWDASETTNKENRIAVYEITSLTGPSNYTKLLDQQYPFGYAHNIWVTEDNKHVIVTGETSVDNQLSFWQLEEDNAKKTLKAKFMNGLNLQGGALAHNAFIKGNHIYISHYTKGVHVAEIFTNSHGEKNIRVKWAYDTYPLNNEGEMDGCWGVYPFAELFDDVFFATDSDTGFYVFRKSKAFIADENATVIQH